MNLFGTFSYGNIIKTFIPGVFFVVAIALLVDDYNYLRSGVYIIFDFTSSNPVLSIALLIPLSIFMGIVSNSLCFTLIIPRFIEQPFKDKNPDFLEYKNSVIKEMKSHYMALLKTPSDMEKSFNDHMDVRSFLLNKKELSTLQYLRESYWYFMEFQVNSIMAITILAFGGVLNIILRYKSGAMPSDMVFAYLIVIFLCVSVLFKMFMSAARENYVKHEKKSLSYLQGAYHICRYGSE